jgi:DNA-binding GntR family transcriptional regulator
MALTAARKKGGKNTATKKKAAEPSRRAARPASALPETSLKEQAYQLIKHRIITCAFRPGEDLNEASVAAMLSFGRTPINQAFDRLRVEGLVDVLPRKGIVVRSIGLEEVIQISEARLLNESYCVRLAAERASATEIAELNDVLAELVKPDNDLERFMILDRDFHQRIAKAAKNDVLADILLNLNERSLRMWSLTLADNEHQASVNVDHREIFRAICHRNADEAEQIMRRHISSFRHTILEKLATLKTA